MLPLYAVRIEDLGRGDFVKDCAACHHVALLTPKFLMRLGLSPRAKPLDLSVYQSCSAGDGATLVNTAGR
jgi:hypothetical protein